MLQCDFQQKCYLYFFNELSGIEKKIFEKHLKSCPQCSGLITSIRRNWQEIEKLPREKPDREVKKSIIRIARKKTARKSLIKTAAEWIKYTFSEYRYFTGIAAAAAVILFITLINPFENIFKSKPPLEWNDDFFTEIESIESGINFIKSGELLSSNFASGKDEQLFDDHDYLSPFSEDLNSIKEDLSYINII